MVVKPDLERCFFNAMSRLKVPTAFKGPSEMHALLARGWKSKKHAGFTQELAALRAVSQKQNIPCLVTELESALRSLL